MAESKHTATPWKISHLAEEYEGGPAIVGGDDYPVATIEDTAIMEDYGKILGIDHWARLPGKSYIDRPEEEYMANAEFVVQAVNSHDDLLEACQIAEQEICELCKKVNPQHKDCPTCDGIEIIRDAIKKAGSA